MPSFPARLAESRIVAVIRGTDGPAAVETALALLAEGLRLVEVTLTTPGALRAIEQIRSHAPQESLIGAGTVLTPRHVSDAAEAGAQFLVTPAVVSSVAAGAAAGLPVLAGALTATEACSAMEEGAAAVKLFPASLGGPAYLTALRDPFPHVPFVAVGGVGLAEAEAFLRAGAVAVGVGGPLVGSAASPAAGTTGGDLTGLRERARAYLDVAQRCQP